MRPDAHIVITDSGLGGLSICAALEKSLREMGRSSDVRLTYVNAWPFADRGYNDLPDAAARARVFDAALGRMAAMQPDRILIACNTLSILYPQTDFARNPPVPVQGIVDAGVGLFAERLGADAEGSIVLIGTRTTIQSDVHRDGLVRRGIDAARIAAVSCHGLAGAIEKDVDGPAARDLISACSSQAAEAAPAGATLYLGLCCTHYGYVAVRLVDALVRKTGRRVRALDPNLQLVGSLVSGEGMFGAARERQPGRGSARQREARGGISVELISKVELDEPARRAIARLIEPVSAVTARALLSYAHVPDLF